MLSYKGRIFLDLELQNLEKERADLFTPEIENTETYKRICQSSPTLSGDELRLENLIRNFNNKIFEARTSIYDANTPSCEERVKELQDLLAEMKKQIQTIKWK